MEAGVGFNRQWANSRSATCEAQSRQSRIAGTDSEVIIVVDVIVEVVFVFIVIIVEIFILVFVFLFVEFFIFEIVIIEFLFVEFVFVFEFFLELFVVIVIVIVIQIVVEFIVVFDVVVDELKRKDLFLPLERPRQGTRQWREAARTGGCDNHRRKSLSKRTAHGMQIG
jgi:hypothetical protein